MYLKYTTWRPIARAALLAALTLLSVELSRASAQIVSTSGLSEISPPASVQPGALDSDTQAFIFEEHASILLTEDLNIDASLTGTVTSSPASPDTIAAGTSIASYYLHFDKIGGSSVFVEVNGDVEFDRDILGIVFLTNSLDDTDPILGFPSTLYPTLNPSRGIIMEFGIDSFTVSEDRRSFQFSLQTANRVDSLRIITAPSFSLGDVDMDGVVDFLDIAPFISILSSTDFQIEADIDQDGDVDFFDISPFIELLSGQ